MILLPGTLVKHPGQPSWGPGEILPGGVAGKVRVRFLAAGEKTLSLSHVQLEVVTKAEADRLRQELRSAPPPHVPGPDPDNPDAEKAFELLQGKEPCVFITGRAGTGKSYLLRYFARKTHKKIVLLAPTGLAALNVGGQTIHSFFMFHWGLMNREDVKEIWDSNKRQLMRKIDTFVIDEVSSRARSSGSSRSTLSGRPGRSRSTRARGRRSSGSSSTSGEARSSTARSTWR